MILRVIGFYGYIVGKKYIKKINKYILKVSFEEFIINFQINKKKINKFLNLNNEKNYNFNLDYSKKNLFKAKQILNSKELNKIKVKLKKFLIWEKFDGIDSV